MAQKPSPKPSPKPAAAKPAPAKKPGGGNRRRTLLLVGIGALALLIGLGVAWFFLVRPSGSGEGGPLRIVKDFLPTGKGDAGKGAKPTGPVLEGTHTVKAGENLWSIAKQGDLVTNPWEWRTILVQNKDKISYAFISEEDGAWKVMVEEGKVLKVKAPGYQADGVSGKQYAVQSAHRARHAPALRHRGGEDPALRWAIRLPLPPGLRRQELVPHPRGLLSRPG